MSPQYIASIFDHVKFNKVKDREDRRVKFLTKTSLPLSIKTNEQQKQTHRQKGVSRIIDQNLTRNFTHGS